MKIFWLRPPHDRLLFDNRALLVMILPMVAELFLNMTVGLADSIMVAAVGESAVSGVSLMDNIFLLILMIFSALSTGGSVVAGQYIGHRDGKMAQKSATELVWSNILLGCIVTVILFIFRGFILNVVFGRIEPEVYEAASTYFLIVNLSVPFMAMYNSAAAIFRCTGNTKLITLDALLMGILNIAGNAVGVFVLNAGVAGVAVPTLVSRAFGGILMLGLLLRPQNLLTIDHTWRHHFDLALIGKTLVSGYRTAWKTESSRSAKLCCSPWCRRSGRSRSQRTQLPGRSFRSSAFREMSLAWQ